MTPVRNLLLDAVRRETGEDLTQRFEPVPLPFGTVLFEEGVRPRYVHFLTSGLTSILSNTFQGDSVEVGMNGNESFPEAPHIIGPQVAATHCIMQVPGTALRMRTKEFEPLFFSNQALQRRVLQAIQYETFMLAQLVACNGVHQIEERLARWLLMVQNRTGLEDLPLTQEFLGQMLGARRSSVTLAAGNLQRAGLIEYRRGNVRVEDRERLEEVACPCYAVIHNYFKGLYR